MFVCRSLRQRRAPDRPHLRSRAPFLDPTDRGDDGNVSIIRSLVRAIVLPSNRTDVRSLGACNVTQKKPAGLVACLQFSERFKWKIMQNGCWTSSPLANRIVFQHTCHQAKWRSKRVGAQPPKHLLQVNPTAGCCPIQHCVPTTSNPCFLASRAPCRSSIKRSVPGCSNASVIASASPMSR